MKFKAILFDLDGTLLDTLDDLADSMNAALAGLSFPIHPVMSYKIFVGDGVEMLARRALPADAQDEKTVAACLQAMRSEYGKRMFDKTKPYAGIPELLDSLIEKKITLCILSNKPDGATQTIVKKLLPDWRFEIVVGQKPGIPKKPDPAAALAIAHDLGIAPGEFLYLGDTSTDMQTAAAAGMFPVGALWGFREEKELRENGARVLINTPGELLSLL